MTHDRRNWPGLLEGSVHSALLSLNYRGYAEPVRWEGRSRLWDITDEGAEAVKKLDIEMEDDE